MATDHQSPTSQSTGGVVEPIYSRRSMKCLIVSESELKQIGLANLGVTVFTAIGSALMSFSFDIAKDTTLSPPDPKVAGVASFADKAAFWSGLLCYIVAFAVWFWRYDMIKTIKEESKGTIQGASK